MPLKTDRDQLDTTIRPDGQQVDYLVLSDEELAKGFVRPLRQRYCHVGIGMPENLRDLTDEEKTKWGDSFAKWEQYPAEMAPKTGRFWSQAELGRIGAGCGSITSMGLKLSETYARQPGFYGATFCARCGDHFPVGRLGEFVWVDDHDRHGDRVGT